MNSDGFTKFENLRPGFLYLLVIGLIVVVYAQTVSFGFTDFDDGTLIRSNYSKLKNLSSIRDVWGLDVFMKKESATFYRPLQVVSYIVDTVIGGERPSSYHLSNLMIHCAMCCSLLYLLLLLRLGKLPALISASFYAVHPVFTHSVCWLPSRGDLLIGLFAIWTLVFYMKYVADGRGSNLIFQGLFFALAVFSKETAVLLPLALLLCTMLFNRKSMKWKNILLASIIWIVVLCVWFILRFNVISATMDPRVAGLVPVLRNLPAIPVLVSKFFIPIDLAPIPSFTLSAIVIGLILIPALFVAAYRSGKLSDPHFLFGVLWFLIFIGPGLWYRPEIGGRAYDYLTQRLYLPGIGLLIAVISLLKTKHLIAGRWPMIAAVCLVCAASVNAFYISRNYQNPKDFYDYAVSMNAESALARNNRGAILRDLGKTDAAFTDLDEAIRLSPEFPEAFYNRGTVFMGTGNPAKAESDFTKAIALTALHVQAMNSRGAARGMLGNFNGALEDFTRLIQLRPDLAEAYFNRGMVKRKLGDTDGAIADFSQAIRCDATYSDAYLNRALAKGSKADFEGAIADFNSVLQYKPGSALAYRNRGFARMKLADPVGARADWEKASRLGDPTATAMLKQSR